MNALQVIGKCFPFYANMVISATWSFLAGPEVVHTEPSVIWAGLLSISGKISKNWIQIRIWIWRTRLMIPLQVSFPDVEQRGAAQIRLKFWDICRGSLFRVTRLDCG